MGEYCSPIFISFIRVKSLPGYENYQTQLSLILNKYFVSICTRYHISRRCLPYSQTATLNNLVISLIRHCSQLQYTPKPGAILMPVTMKFSSYSFDGFTKKLSRDPNLLDDYETDVLPVLSMANVREMLRATLPLKQLSPLEAANLVDKHLDNRTPSR